KYYVNQILSLDEDSLRRSWNKVCRANRDNQIEKDARIEYLSWRVWAMKRKRAAIAARQAYLRRVNAVNGEEDDESDERTALLYLDDLDTTVNLEVGWDLATEKGVAPSAAVSPPTEADLDLLVHRYPRLYVVLISLHGLVRGSRMELGRDPDTGGQVKYVVELARALGRIPSVARVDLLTRLIADPKVRHALGWSVSGPENPPCGGDGGSDPLTGAFIVRLPCGPSDVYLRKEDLWPYIRDFADRALRHITSTLARLSASGTPSELWAVHGHYADAGEAAALIAASLGCPMLMTGHSLGRNKKAHLLASGSVSLSEMEATYRISRRIEAEERSLDSAVVVFTSTQQEVKEQWGLYDGYRERLAEALTQRGVPGLHVPAMAVIPPGLDFSALKVALPADPISQLLERHTAKTSIPRPRSPALFMQVHRFLRNPAKPVILAMSRPDAKKNVAALIKAYGSSAVLRDLANLVLVLGNRDVIDSMASGSARVMEGVLKLVDAYDLYGSVAYPKRHSQSDISDIYHLAAATRGVFVNVALQVCEGARRKGGRGGGDAFP
ncbi:hypothetical protein VOLCADRAFT_57787, partial [Volvox carteri f. nagariensis]